MKANTQKNSAVLANLLVISEERPLTELEVRTLMVICDRSSIDEIEKSVKITKKARTNPALRGQVLRDKPKMLSPKILPVRKPQRKKGYTDKGSLADENSVVRKKVLNESLVYLPALEVSTKLTLYLKRYAKGEWFSVGDWDDFLIWLEKELRDVPPPKVIREFEDAAREQVEKRLQHPYRWRNSEIPRGEGL